MKLSIIIPTLVNRVPTSVIKFAEGRDDVEIVKVVGVSPVSRARREGFERAKGEYVWFVDDDDEISPSGLGEIGGVGEGSGSKEVGVESGREDVDIYRFAGEGWMCIGDKIYRREVLAQAFAEMGEEPMTRFEDGLLYATALKYAKKVEDVDREIYVYQRRDDSASHQFDPMIVREAERLAAVVPERAEELFTYIVTEMCRVKAGWGEIRKVLGELRRSSLMEAAKRSKDAYTRKMVWAVKWPGLVRVYRFFRPWRSGGSGE